jgi:hypothetical protein
MTVNVDVEAAGLVERNCDMRSILGLLTRLWYDGSEQDTRYELG